MVVERGCCTREGNGGEKNDTQTEVDLDRKSVCERYKVLSTWARQIGERDRLLFEGLSDGGKDGQESVDWKEAVLMSGEIVAENEEFAEAIIELGENVMRLVVSGDMSRDGTEGGTACLTELQAVLGVLRRLVEGREGPED